MSMLTILHVSDVHFQSDVNAQQRRIADLLVEAAHRHSSDHGHSAPDVCVFTGDLAYGGAPDEFQVAEQWLQKLVKKWDCKIFIVPGNHDVARQPSRKGRPRKIILDYRAAAHGRMEYKGYREQPVKKASLLRNFIQWHDRARRGLKLVSDWKTSPFACTYIHKSRGMETVFIGLNTALLSCNDDDLGNLVADEEEFVEHLGGVQVEKQLVIVASHHPIGSEKTASNRWLADWNAKKLEELLLQATGPHIYLHGHLHEEHGITLNLSTGQSLAFFGAGAAYDNPDHPEYPLRFGFYDIDLLNGRVKPWVYTYNLKSGEWEPDGTLSKPVQAVLPRPKHHRGNDAEAHVVGLKGLLREIIDVHVQIRGMLSQQLPRVAPDLDPNLTPRLRMELLEREYKKYHCAPLIKQIDSLSPAARDELAGIRALAENGNPIPVIGLLRGKPAFQQLLLTALVLSKDDSDWVEAEQLVGTIGTPFHYFYLSYVAWAEGTLNRAICFAEKALELALQKDQHEEQDGVVAYDGTSIAKIQNNIAYYYADASIEEKAQIALDFAGKAVSAVEGKEDAKPLYANYLDTLGFVRIVFATTRAQLEDGVWACEEARRCGADSDLYFKHIARAQARLESLPTS